MCIMQGLMCSTKPLWALSAPILEQEQNWDITHERGTRQLFQLCQTLFTCTDSDPWPLVSLPSAQVTLISQSAREEIFSLGSPSQEIQLQRKSRAWSGTVRDQGRAVGRKSWWPTKEKCHFPSFGQEEGQQPEKQMSSWRQWLTAVMEIWVVGDSLVLST